MDSLLTPEVLQVTVGLLGGALLALLAKLIKSQVGKQVAEKVLEKGLDVAYNAASAHAAKTPGTLDDKLTMALGFLNDFVKSHGVELTTDQVTKAKIVLAAMHGQSMALPPVVAK